MSNDREWEVRLQFLDEARDYLRDIESEVLGLSDRSLSRGAIDKMLRAAHSIKGGSAMMGFHALSDLAHKIEDSFKVLQSGKKTADQEVEGLFLFAIDTMGKVAEMHGQRTEVDESWLKANASAAFDRLYELLGEPSNQDGAEALSAEAGVDMRVLMFETEVDACLQRLSDVLAAKDSLVLREEFLMASQEFGCLGEMLEMPQFVTLCQGITDTLEDRSQSQDLATVAKAALDVWQHSQALVLVGQFEMLPTQFALAAPASNLTDVDADTNADADVSLAQPTPLTEAINQVRSQERHEPAIAEFPDLADLADSTEITTQESLLQQSEDSEEMFPSLDQAFLAVEPEVPDELGQVDLSLFGDEVAPLAQGFDFPSIESEDLVLSLEQIAEQSQQKNLTTSDSNLFASKLESAPAQIKDGSEATIRIPVRQLEALSDCFGELNAERSGLRSQMRRLQDLVKLLGTRVHGLEQSNLRLRETYDRVATSYEPITAGALVGASVGASDRRGIPSSISFSPASPFDLLEMDRYSEMHLVSREIMDSVVQLQEVSSDIDTALSETEGTERQLGRASRQLQNAIEQARMRSLNEVLSRFPRVLRELSLVHGKQVELQFRGSSTLVERSVLEALEDPLLHLIRNAFDHGIELPEARIAAGKTPKGKIEIAAGYRGNQTVITLSDDGGGISLEKVRNRALKMGLSSEELEHCSEAELLELIFEPGFSTADRVTELSGRGVGMDIVRSSLAAIGGSVRVETKLQQGTSFILTVPMSLSIARVLLFESNGMLMAMQTSAVEEMLLVRELTVHSVADQEVLDWEGYSVPMIRLGDRLRFGRPKRQFESEIRPIIDEQLALIVTRNNVPFALQVDRYWGEQEVTTRLVQSHIALPHGFMGCAVLGGGRIVPLVDIDDLLNWTVSEEDLSVPILPPQSTKGDQRTTVMVVDDSINVRRFLAMTLEKAGYRVEQAKDGQEAMEKLQANTQSGERTDARISAVVCDIEMPRLDGFGFLVQSRADPNCSQIPVVMLTSRSGTKHRDLAMRLGASDYFSKPFKDKDLLQTLSQLTRTS
jgi:two-component system, chemotaxis family, sensor histidine kinase and response regulator PixL